VPPGSGTSVAVLVRLQLDASQKFDSSCNLLDYEAPSIASLSHPNCSASSPVVLADCPRLGSGLLTVAGSNFGPQSAVVLVGSRICTGLTHDAASPSAAVYCTLPDGVEPGVLVLLIQSGGSVSAERTSLGYTQCVAGTFQNGTSPFCAPCTAGRYTEDNGSTQCKDCGAGRFAAATLSSSCLDCQAGSYQQAPAQSACVNCSSGSFTSYATTKYQCAPCQAGEMQPLVGQTDCAKCAYGSFKASPGNATCQACAVGTFTSEATTLFACASCDAGRYQNASGATVCLQCEVGFAQLIPGAAQCNPCLPGRASRLVGSFACALCDKGSYQPYANATSCEECSYGKNQDQIGQSSCADCRAGRFAGVTGTIQCQDCEAGKSQNLSAQLSCTPCPAGQVQEKIGQSSCADCRAGRFAGVTGTIQCQDCEAGKTQNLVAQPSCKPCPEGQFMPDQGSNASACRLCAVGHFSTGRSWQCDECKSSIDYQPREGQSACLTCPASAQAVTNHSACACNAGFYAVSDSSSANDTLSSFVCVKCPEGADCSATGTRIETVKSLNGYFAPKEEGNKSFVKCLNDDACSEGGCKPGYTGCQWRVFVRAMWVRRAVLCSWLV
jgi:hypothetical protein